MCETDKSCDHDWRFVDNSFDHEFGTRTVQYERCSLCGETRDIEPDELGPFSPDRES